MPVRSHLLSIVMLSAVIMVGSNTAVLGAGGPKTYPMAQGGEITLPMGDLSFADRVVSFVEGTPHAAFDNARDPNGAVGPLDYDFSADDGRYVTLGCGGEITLEFVNNALIDVPGPDLHIWEVGPDIEPTNLAISKDGENWVEVGRIEGSTASIDIAEFVQPGDSFRFVRLTDLEQDCHNRWPGADIAAVAAVGTAERFVFDSAVLFGFDEDELAAEAQAVLDGFAQTIAEQPFSGLRVEGHTDSVGSADYNADLSLRRAEAVRRYLETLPTLESLPITTRGAGLSEPVANNDTEEGRARNRRVEIIALP